MLATSSHAMNVAAVQLAQPSMDQITKLRVVHRPNHQAAGVSCGQCTGLAKLFTEQGAKGWPMLCT
eukprot:scaffold285_cov21-Tisochrysis_lutea.AAC.3